MDTISEWWETAQPEARGIWTELLEEAEDITGIGAVLSQMWKLPERKRPGGIYLIGQAGSGKHSSAASFTRFLEEEYQFETLYLTGEVLWEQETSSASAIDKLNHILNAYYDDNKKALCLVLEHWESYPEQAVFLDFLQKTLKEYRDGAMLPEEEKYPPLFLILISEQEQKLPFLLRKQLRVQKCSLPDTLHRRQFFRKSEVDPAYLTPERLAELTDGCTYPQLSDLVCQLELLVIHLEEDGLDEAVDLTEFVESFVRGSVPEPDESVYRKRFFQKAEETMEQLPKLLEQIANRESIYMPAANDTVRNEAASSDAVLEKAISTQVSEKELQDMRVKDLISITFSEEMQAELFR